MENKYNVRSPQIPDSAAPLPVGPLPARPGTVEPMSAARAAVLHRLNESDAACTVESLAGAVGQHHNTIREHLQALVSAGLARSETAAPAGRGRPARVYHAVHVADVSHGYGALAGALADQISRSSDDPQAEGVRAGRRWAGKLLNTSGRQPTPSASETLGRMPQSLPSPSPGRAKVVQVLEAAGFGVAPVNDADTIRLVRCPLLEAAREHPEVVCSVHLGLVKETMEDSGQDSGGVELLPFAERGACRLTLDAAVGS